MNRLTLATTAVLVLAGPVWATPIEFSATSGDRAAWASLEVVGDHLQVTLANVSSADALIPENVLTGLFFNSDLGLSLLPLTAVVPAGSSVLFGTTETGGSVGGEWAYADSLAGAPGGRTYGISSSGLGLFGPGDRFPGKNLQGPASVGGLDYGIVSAADNPLTGNTPVTGKNSLIQDRVVFTFAAVPSGFNPAAHVRDVFFQYGTSLEEGGMPGQISIPEPGMLAMFSLSSLLILRRGLRR